MGVTGFRQNQKKILLSFNSLLSEIYRGDNGKKNIRRQGLKTWRHEINELNNEKCI